VRLEDMVLPSAAVATDRSDYVLGQSAMITASGFAVGETVRFQVLHTDGTPNTSPDNAPWTVTDGGPDDLDGTANGVVQTYWGVSNPNNVGSSLRVTATGQTSGLSAQASFTDTSSPNLVLNGGFETGDFTNWTVTGNNGYTDVERIAHSGTYAAHLGPIGSLGFITQTQTLSTIPGAQYTFSYWLEVDSGTPNRFEVNWGTQTVFDRTNMAAQGYHLYTFTVTATSTSTSLQFGFRHDPAWFNLDDISVQLNQASNHAPIANNVSVTTNEDTAKAFALDAHDPDGNPLTYTIVDNPAHGQLSGTGPNLTYTPDPNYNGPDSFIYKANDGISDSNLATVSFTVNPVNDAPTAGAGTASTAEDTPVTIDLRSLVGDVETAPGDMTYTITAAPTATVTGSTSSNPSSPGTLTPVAGSNGVFLFTPSQDFNGTVTFSYRVTDRGDPDPTNSNALSSDPATVTITITPVNDAPILTSPGDQTVNEQSPLTFALSASDVDHDTLTYLIVTGNQAGMSLTSDGHFSWTPTEAQDGSYSVTFGVSDGNGGTDQKTINITVKEVNTPPTLHNVPTSLNGIIKTTSVGFTAGATDPDTVNPNAVPNTLTFGLTGAPVGASINSSTGVFIWTPSQDQDGPFTFSVTVSDQTVTTSQQITITTVAAGIDASGNLLIVGHSTADTIQVDGTNPSQTHVTINGNDAGTFNVGSANVVVHAYEGDDTVVLNGNRPGTVVVDGGAGANSLIVNTGGGADAVAISNTQVVVTGGATVNYSSVATLTANTGAGGDAVTVNASGAGLPGQINVNTGDDDDQIVVNLGGGTTAVSVDGGGNTTGDSLIANGAAGPDSIAVTGAVLTGGGASVGFTGIENLTVAAGAGNDGIAVSGTSLTGGLTLTGGDDADSVTLGNVSAGQVYVTAEAIALNGPVTTTGGQTYTGPVTLAATLGLTAGAVTFADMVSGGYGLTVNSGGATSFAKSVNVASLTTDVGGTTAINGGSVTTTGAQAYGDPVTLGVDTAITGGGVAFGGSVSGVGKNLSIASTGSISFGQSVSVQSLTILNATNVTAMGLVTTAANLTQNAGSGATMLNGANVGGGLSIAADSVTLSTAQVTTVGAVSIVTQNAVSVLAGLNTGASTITIGANADGSGNQGFTQGPGAIVTGNATAAAVSITVGGSGNATIQVITTGLGGKVSITAGGAILDGNGAADNVTTSNLALSAGAGIGTAADPVETVTATGGSNPTINMVLFGGSGGVYVTNSGSVTLASSQSLDSEVIIAHSPLTVTGPVSSTGGTVTLTADGGNLSVAGTTVSAGNGGDVNLNAHTLSIDPTASIQTTGNVGFNADTATLTNAHLPGSKLTFSKSNASIDLGGADFSSLTNSGTSTAINLNGAKFDTLVNSGEGTTSALTSISLNGADFHTLSNSAAGTTVYLNGAVFDSLVNTGGSSTAQTTINLNGADFSSLSNSATGTQISLNGASFLLVSNTADGVTLTGLWSHAPGTTQADFGSLSNSGAGAVISLNGAIFDTLVNTGGSQTGQTSISLNGADFNSLTNSAAGTGISLNGASFDSVSNTADGVHVTGLWSHAPGTTQADFGSLSNSGTGAVISLNGAIFDTLVNTGGSQTGQTSISLNGAVFDTLGNSAAGTFISLNGATFTYLINANIAEATANGADFGSLTDVGGQAHIAINGAKFDTLVNAGDTAQINLNGAVFDTLVNSGNATGSNITVNLNGANFDSLYNFGSGTQIAINGADFSTLSNGVVSVNLNGADFQTLVNTASGTTIYVNGAVFDTLVNSGGSTSVPTTINLNGASFDSLVNSATGTQIISLNGADFNSLQNTGSSTSIAINGADFNTLTNSGSGTQIAINGSSFQFVQNDGDNANLVLSLSSAAGSATLANNGNNTGVSFTGGAGADVFVNDARGDATHGNNVCLNVNLCGGNDRFVIGGTGVTGTLTGGSGDDLYTFVGGLNTLPTGHSISEPTSNLTIQEADNADTDTLDFSNLTTGAVTVDLANTTKQQIGVNFNLTLSNSNGIENVVGTQFADTISGNARDNQIYGADLPDDRIGPAAPGNTRVQKVFLDFDTDTSGKEHIYSPAERASIQKRLELDYFGPDPNSPDPSNPQPNYANPWFHVQFTQSKPSGTDFATVFFNEPRHDANGDQPGGNSSDIDFGNWSYTGWASVAIQVFDANGSLVSSLIGGTNQPPEYNGPNQADQSWNNDNWVRASSWIAAHEVGHLLGLRHADSFGPIGYGVHAPPQGVLGFHMAPAFNGPAAAFETNFHLIATPAMTGFTLNDLVSDTFFGEREAVKLAFDQAVPVDANNQVTPTASTTNSLLVNETNGNHSSRAPAGTPNGAQQLTLMPLTVPDTLSRGLNSIKQFQVGAVDIVGHIGSATEHDVYSLSGRKGDLLNVQVMSEALDRYRTAGQAIDAVLTVYDASGNVVVATSDDEFEDHDPSLIDFYLPADGVYYLDVSAAGAHDGLSATGSYELFAYRFDTSNSTDGNDTLEGRGGDDTLAGGLGDDTYVFNGVNLGNDTIKEDVRYEAQGGAAGIPGRDSRDKLDFSGFGAAINLNLGSTGSQTVAVGNLSLTLSSALGIEDVVLPKAFNASVAGNARDNTFIWINRQAGYTGTVTDTITGSTGMDTLDYSALTAGVTVDLSSRAAQTVGGGYGLTLTAEDMENVAGSATAANTLTGNTLNNVMIGGNLNDTMDGGSGNDILIGNAGDDTLTGGAGDDILDGGTGADRLVASSGNDILIAGYTDYDFTGYNPAKTATWLGILSAWRSSSSAAGSLLTSSTVHSDTSVDKLTGSSGTNWFFVDITADVDPVDTVTGNTRNSIFTYIV
jgi:hypothetical protein